VKVRWTVAANQDRAEIIDYIAEENPRAALKMDELFSEAAAKLADFPMLGLVSAISSACPHAILVGLVKKFCSRSVRVGQGIKRIDLERIGVRA